MAYDYFRQFNIHKSLLIFIKTLLSFTENFLVYLFFVSTVLQMLEGLTSKINLKVQCTQVLW